MFGARFITISGMTLLLFTLGGCARTPRVRRPPSASDCAAAFGAEVADRQRLAAMISIAANAYFPDKDFPPHTSPIDLGAAVITLNCDVALGGGADAWSRRRRAIAKLAAYGLERPLTAQTISDLGGDIETIRSFVETQAAGLGEYLRGNTAVLESAIADMPGLQSGSSPGIADPPDAVDPATGVDALTSTCALTWEELYDDVYGAGPTVSAVASIRIERPLAEVAKALDPQSWGKCSKFYEPGATYLITGNVTDPLTCPATPDKPMTLGTPYHRALYEHFTCVKGCDANFQNLLAIKTFYDNPDATPCTGAGGTNPCTRYRVDFGLKTVCAAQLSNEKVNLTTDQGELQATIDPKDPRWTRVYFVKRLSFGDPVFNGAMEAVLENTELAGELGEFACCTP